MYFDRFPYLNYTETFDGVGKRRLVTDIIRRIRISERSKNDASFFIDYDLKEGDTPENISHRLYGTSSYFWTVLLVNEAINPFYSFSLDSLSLENYAKKKYFGRYFYLVDPSNEKRFSGLTFGSDETIFLSTTNVDDFGTTQENFTVRARVVEQDSTLGRIRVDGGEHTYFSAGDIIGVYRGSDVRQAKIKKTEDGLYGLHHFQTVSGSRINPLAALDGTPLGFTSMTGDYTIDPPELWETRIGAYLGLSGSATSDYSVSNFDYEITQNESKGQIQLIHPDNINLFVEEFDRILNI